MFVSMYVYIYPASSNKQDVTQDQFFKSSTGLKSEFSFS